MATHHREPVICQCGHKGEVRWSENDQPYSKAWEKYSISGFSGESFSVEGFIDLDKALETLKPQCPECGMVSKVKYL